MGHNCFGLTADHLRKRDRVSTIARLISFGATVRFLPPNGSSSIGLIVLACHLDPLPTTTPTNLNCNANGPFSIGVAWAGPMSLTRSTLVPVRMFLVC
jgi:hypothetical protein